MDQIMKRGQNVPSEKLSSVLGALGAVCDDTRVFYNAHLIDTEAGTHTVWQQLAASSWLLCQPL